MPHRNGGHNPRTVRKSREPECDFELVFDEIGRVQLKDRGGDVIWSSDNDDDFAEEFDNDFFDSEDADDILDYLSDEEIITDDDEIDIVELDLEDSDDGPLEPLEGELIPARRRRT